MSEIFRQVGIEQPQGLEAAAADGDDSNLPWPGPYGVSRHSHVAPVCFRRLENAKHEGTM
jgi:hypothetical protein